MSTFLSTANLQIELSTNIFTIIGQMGSWKFEYIRLIQMSYFALHNQHNYDFFHQSA